MHRGEFKTADGRTCVAGRLHVASAANLSESSPVVDTTGAGDAFNAALLFGLARGAMACLAIILSSL